MSNVLLSLVLLGHAVLFEGSLGTPVYFQQALPWCSFLCSHVFALLPSSPGLAPPEEKSPSHRSQPALPHGAFRLPVRANLTLFG